MDTKELIESKELKENCKVELVKFYNSKTATNWYFVTLIDYDTGHSPGHRSYKELKDAKRYFKTFK